MTRPPGLAVSVPVRGCGYAPCVDLPRTVNNVCAYHTQGHDKGLAGAAPHPRPPFRRSGRRYLVGNSTESTIGAAASTALSKVDSGATIAMARIRMDDPSGTSNR